MYGFRHPSLRIASFYDKLSVRKAQTTRDDPYCGGITELIAAGSGEECAVIFPTNERYLNKAAKRAPTVNFLPSKPRLTRTTSTRSTSYLNHIQNQNQESTGMETEPDPAACPIYQHGTALFGGHKKEVTAVAWANNGNLVTVADDCTTRVWRENADKARALRMNSERSVERFNSGWAEVRDGFDNDE
jgi:WD40 repeat protein